MEWAKVTAGTYQSICGNYRVERTYTRSGWVCWDRAAGWHTYARTLEFGKAILEGRHNAKATGGQSPAEVS